MARTSITPWDTQSIAQAQLSMRVLDMASNYAVTKDEPGETVVKNIASAVNLEEQVSYKYQKLDKISTTLNGMYPQTTKNGYQIVIKDEYILRTTEDDGTTVHDDPVVCYFTFRTTSGANMPTGEAVFSALKHVLSTACLQNGESVSNAPLDRLIRGATKPAALV